MCPLKNALTITLALPRKAGGGSCSVCYKYSCEAVTRTNEEDWVRRLLRCLQRVLGALAAHPESRRRSLLGVVQTHFPLFPKRV